jgi:hypothetical protein
MHQKTSHFERHTPATYEEEQNSLKERIGTVVRKVKGKKKYLKEGMPWEIYRRNPYCALMTAPFRIAINQECKVFILS